MSNLTINDLKYDLFTEDEAGNIVMSKVINITEDIPDMSVTKEWDIQDLWHSAFDENQKLRIVLTD